MYNRSSLRKHVVCNIETLRRKLHVGVNSKSYHGKWCKSFTAHNVITTLLPNWEKTFSVTQSSKTTEEFFCRSSSDLRSVGKFGQQFRHFLPITFITWFWKELIPIDLLRLRNGLSLFFEETIIVFSFDGNYESGG